MSVSNFTVNNNPETLYSGNELVAREVGSSTNEGGLAEAMLVSPSEVISTEDLELAHPVIYDEPRGQKSSLKEKHAARSCLLGWFVCLVTLVGITVALVFQRQGPTQSKSNSNPTMSTTVTPTPTLAPTTDNIMGILPLSIQWAIIQDETKEKPQSRSFSWLQDDPNIRNYSNHQLLQRFALASLYFTSDGNHWDHRGGNGTVTLLLPV